MHFRMYFMLLLFARFVNLGVGGGGGARGEKKEYTLNVRQLVVTLRLDVTFL